MTGVGAETLEVSAGGYGEGGKVQGVQTLSLGQAGCERHSGENYRWRSP